MAKIRRSGLALPPGNYVGEVLTWDGVRWGPQPIPTPPIPAAPSGGDILIYNTTINQFVPASQLSPLPNARQMFAMSSFTGQPDGTAITTWPDISGNALDVANGGGADRPTLVTDPVDLIRAMRFDGVDDFFRRLAMPAVNTQDLTVFIVSRHYITASDVPWSLGRAAVASNAAGCARGLIGAASINMGAQANGLGGALAHGPGNAVQDSAAAVNTAGQYGPRRAYCFKWTAVHNRWTQLAYMGGHCAGFPLDVTPPANLFTFTACVLGAENNGGGAPTLFCEQDLSYLAYYEGANSFNISAKLVWQELQRLQALYQAL